MQADAAESVEETGGRKRLLLPLLLTVALGGAGFASTYLGLWSPLGFLSADDAPTYDAASLEVAFVDVPVIELTLPGGRHRTLVLQSKIETVPGAEEEIEKLLPRVLDSFNGFLSGVDPVAFDKRGVLEIIKFELTTRAHETLGDLPVNDILITEFRLK